LSGTLPTVTSWTGPWQEDSLGGKLALSTRDHLVVVTLTSAPGPADFALLGKVSADDFLGVPAGHLQVVSCYVQPTAPLLPDMKATLAKLHQIYTTALRKMLDREDGQVIIYQTLPFAYLVRPACP
jgi:hypothetical protein